MMNCRGAEAEPAVMGLSELPASAPAAPPAPAPTAENAERPMGASCALAVAPELAEARGARLCAEPLTARAEFAFSTTSCEAYSQLMIKCSRAKDRAVMFK